MSKEQNIAATEKMGEAVNHDRLSELNQVFARSVKDHDPAPDQGPGPEGFVKFFTGFRNAFPDLKIEVEQMVADEENVAIAYTVTGTQDGNFQGIPPTHKKIKVRGVQIARFEAGRIVERWGSSDELGILKQIGVVPSTSPRQVPALSGKEA
jgi:steroid delta-isomerase-like uncharacterized protein